MLVSRHRPTDDFDRLCKYRPNSYHNTPGMTGKGCAIFVTERRRGADPNPERFQHTGDIVLNPTVRSPAPFYTIQFRNWIIYARPVVTFAIFLSSHLLRINCYQLSDPRRDGGLGWPVVHPRFYSLIDSTRNRNPDLMRNSRHKLADALTE